jgi:hypothetical protein
VYSAGVADSPFRERRYRIEEVRDVVKQALAREPEPRSPGRALTRDELGHLLMDLGVSTEVAERSLDEAGTSAAKGDLASTETSWLGGPRRLVFETELDGELPDERREDLVEAIVEEMGEPGRVDTLGRTITWTPQPTPNNQQRKLTVKVRVRDGRTRIRIEEDLTPLRLGAWLGFGMGGGLGLGVLGVATGKAAGSAAVGVLTWLLILLLSFLAAWATTRGMTRRRARQLDGLKERMGREVARTVRLRARVATPPDEEQAREEAAIEEAAAIESARPRNAR